MFVHVFMCLVSLVLNIMIDSWDWRRVKKARWLQPYPGYIGSTFFGTMRNSEVLFIFICSVCFSFHSSCDAESLIFILFTLRKIKQSKHVPNCFTVTLPFIYQFGPSGDLIWGQTARMACSEIMEKVSVVSVNIWRNPWNNWKHMFPYSLGGEAYSKWYLHAILSNGINLAVWGNEIPHANLQYGRLQTSSTGRHKSFTNQLELICSL